MKSAINNKILTILAALLLAGCATINTPDLTDLGDGTMRLSSSPLQWQLERSPYITTWDEAAAYVAALDLGGHHDWRLPTREELLDLYFVFDFGNAREEGKIKALEGYYWVAERDGTGYLGAWKDGESCEITRRFDSASRGGYVMAVRP